MSQEVRLARLEYQILFELWKREKESRELQPLVKGFYTEASAYLRSKGEEKQMLDERSLRARLLDEELSRVQRILTDLVEVRFQKITWMVVAGKTPSADLLALEEESLVNGITSVRDQVDRILHDVLRGRPPQVKEVRIVERPNRMLVRFLQDIPAIVGPNARAYGPFRTEDIAALPAENAESLIKRGVAVRVETE